MVQQLLKYEIQKQMGVFYDSNINFNRSDYSISDIVDTNMCFVRNEPLGLYSLSTGITHLHRTFHSSYVVKFFLEGNTTEGLMIHEIGSFASSKQQPQPNHSNTFTLVKERDKIDFRRSGFRIQNDTTSDVYIGKYKRKR